MSNATLIAILLMIPMALLTVAQIGMLRSRKVFAIVGFFVMIITCGLLLAASFASQMAAGSGSGGSGGWEGWWPLPLCIGFGILLLVLGVVSRPKVTLYDVPEVVEEKKLPTMREAEEARRQ